MISFEMHPSTNLLVSTLIVAAEHLMHFFLILFPSTVFFALVASWRWGKERHELTSAMSSLFTLWEAVLGPPGVLMSTPAGLPEDGEGIELKLFLSIYFMIIFLFMFNFLLAIIVDSYAKVRDELDKTDVQMNIFVDVYYTFAYIVKRMLYQLPSRNGILLHIEVEVEDDGTFTIEKDLAAMFPKPSSLQKFKDHYSKESFGFLYKDEAEDQALSPAEVARQQDTILRRVTSTVLDVHQMVLDLHALRVQKDWHRAVLDAASSQTLPSARPPSARLQL